MLRVLFHSVSTTLSHMATFHVLGSIRKQLCKKLSTIPLGSVLDDNSGTYKNIIVERVDSMETTLAHVVPEFTANILLPAVIFIYLLSIDWRVGLSNLIPAVIGLGFVVVMMKKSQGEYDVTVQKTKYLNDTAVEYINGIEVIKAFGKTGSSYEKFVVAAREGADCFINWMRKCIWWQAGSLSFMPATFLGVLPIGLICVRNGSLTAENFITCIILSAGLITPLVVAFSYMDDIMKMKTIFGEATEIIEREDMERPVALTEKPVGTDIVLSGVKFAYKDKEILHGIDMEIRQGEVNAFVGPSGSGKSTIARLIDSLWDVKEGSVTYGGVNIKNLPLDYYTSQIAYVAQDNFLFDMSVKENIRIGKASATDEEVVAAAKATAYTDPENEALVQNSVAKLVKGKTLIVIAHRLSTIMDADKIFVINKGKVEAVGTHGKLLNVCPLYRNMWNAHIVAKDDDSVDLVHLKKTGGEAANA